MTEQTYRSSAVTYQSIQVLSPDGRPAPVPDWLESGSLWENAADTPIVLVVLDSRCQVPTSLIARSCDSATVLVMGPCDRRSWREESLAAGAFGCLSAATPLEDRVGLLIAAVRYEATRSEISTLRQHSDRLCFELVQSFGDAMNKLSGARDEAGRIRRALEDIQLRVLRTLV